MGSDVIVFLKRHAPPVTCSVSLGTICPYIHVVLELGNVIGVKVGEEEGV